MKDENCNGTWGGWRELAQDPASLSARIFTNSIKLGWHNTTGERQM